MKETSVIPSEATSISSEMNGDALEWGMGPRLTVTALRVLGDQTDMRLSVPMKSQHRCVNDRSEQMALYSHFLTFSIMETEVT